MTSTASHQPSDEPDRHSLPAPKRAVPAPRRGGRRPGAGGRPGNLNALKHGRRSAQFAQLGLILATIPETRQALLHLAARHRLKQRKAEQVAVLLLNAMMERARSMAERQTINRNEAAAPTPQIRRESARKISPPEPSNPKPAGAQSIKNQIRKTN